MSDRSRKPDVLVLPIDLPYATPTALRNVIGQRADTVIVPDSECLGTNLLLLRSSAFRHFSFAFGVNSFERHCAAARASGHALEIIVNDERLSRDVDQPMDYVRWAETMSQPLPLLA
jgi:2-phospho-L-lactate guanylyltransferase (CobY/MobA/RfbA family)